MRTTQRLGDLLIETPNGWIPARQIAEIKETDGPNQILRENGRRRIVVFANTDAGANLTTIVAAVRQEVAATALPEGYFIEPRRHLPGAGGGEPHHRRCCRRSRSR